MIVFISYLCVGLSVYAVDGQSPNRNQDEWYKEQWPTQPYAFGYEIRDYSGNEQYRKEMSDGERVTGSYGYLGPDGLYRHVEYVADENGFRAKIRTSEPGTANDNPSNVQIESNPIPVPSNPTPSAGGPPPQPYNPGSGGSFRRTDIPRPQGTPASGGNPDRSTYGTRQLDPLPPRRPDPSRGGNPNPSPDVLRDRVNTNRGSDVSGAGNPNYNDPNIRGDNRGGGRVGADRVPYADIPDNIVPYRGANPKKPVIKDSVTPLNEFVDQSLPKFGSNPDYNDPRNPSYSRNEGVNPRLPDPQAFVDPTDPPYDRQYDRREGRGRNPQFDDNRDPPIGGYEVTTKGGAPKGPQKTFGFIEATKGPITPIKPINRFFDGKRPQGVFYDDNEDRYDQHINRRVDDDQRVSVVNKPVFEGVDTPRKVGVFVRNRYNATAPDVKGVKHVGAPTPPPIRDSFNRSLNGTSYEANQDRRDKGYDNSRRRPTKVFVTSGPISGGFGGDNRAPVPPIKGSDRPFGAIDAQQRQQHIDVDYDDNKGISDDGRDGQQISPLDGIKGRVDRDRPQPPPRELMGIQIPPQALDIRPYYGARHQGQGARNRSQETVPQQRPQITARPVPPYDPRFEQQNIQTSDEDIPDHQQRDDEYPIDQQQIRPLGPQLYQPLRPNGRPDRQPSPPPPRRQDRPYKPRTQDRGGDRGFVEQQHVEVQPYQTQSSATISSPVNTIANVYKPIDSLDDNKRSDGVDGKDRPNLNTPLSPSSYVVTPFPVNQSIVQIKPILDNRPDTYTVAPEVTQMEIPKFGTRIRIPGHSLEEVYEPGEEFVDQHNAADPQNQDYHQNSDQNVDNPNDYSDDNGNNVHEESPALPPIPPIDNPMAQPLIYENIDGDQYYYDDNEGQPPAQDVEDNPEKSIDSKSLVYTQTISQSHRSDQKVDISSQSNSSSPIEITHKVMNVLNWHKYDKTEGTGS